MSPNPVAAPDALAEAGRLVREGDHAGAEAALKKILASDPENGAAYYLLGVSTAALGRKEEAATHLAGALSSTPRELAFDRSSRRLQLRKARKTEP